MVFFQLLWLVWFLSLFYFFDLLCYFPTSSDFKDYVFVVFVASYFFFQLTGCLASFKVVWMAYFFHCTQENTRLAAAFYLAPGGQNCQGISMPSVFLFNCSFQCFFFLKKSFCIYMCSPYGLKVLGGLSFIHSSLGRGQSVRRGGSFSFWWSKLPTDFIAFWFSSHLVFLKWVFFLFFLVLMCSLQHWIWLEPLWFCLQII